MIPILLSIIIPGLGQVYCKRYPKGILMMLLAVLPYIYLLILGWSIYDIIKYRNKGIEVFSTKETVLGVIVFFVIVPFGFYGPLWGHEQLTTNYLYPKNTKSELKEMSVAIEKYSKDTGRLPETLTEIIDSKPIREPWKVDPWGNQYIYELQGSVGFILFSKGKDGLIGTEDDIRIESLADKK